MLKEKTLLVLGHKGMLGQMVVKYFKDRVKYLKITDKRFDTDNIPAFFDESFNDVDIVINCIGKIPQKSQDSNQLYTANALLPLALNEFLPENVLLVHPSTDCVFSGQKGEPYKVTDVPDAVDSYGLSKRLGETALKNRKNTLILRVSIIGPYNTKGLLGWFLSNTEGSRLKGYTNHLWNGITTLEWCKQAEKIIEQHKAGENKLIQLGTKEFYSKYELLLLFQKVFGTDFTIEPFETVKPIDKRLLPEIVSDNLELQIRQLNFF